MLQFSRFDGRCLAVTTVFFLLLAGWPNFPQSTAQRMSDQVSSVRVDLAIDSRNVDVTNQRYRLNLQNCADFVDARPEIPITWTFVREPLADAEYTLKVRFAGEQCNTSSMITEASDECLTLLQEEPLTSRTIRQTLDFEQLFDNLVGVADCSVNSGKTYDLVLVFSTFDSTTSGEDSEYDEVRFELVTTRPAAPLLVTAEAGESTILVDWEEVSAAERYRVYYSTGELLAGSDPRSISARSSASVATSVSITDDLESDETYYLAVTSINQYGNESYLSQVVEVITQPVTDFWEYYRQQGGSEVGGYCTIRPSAGIGWATILLVLLGATLFTRNRRPRCKRRSW